MTQLQVRQPAPTRPRPRLDVYVAEHCPSCPEAIRLATVASERYPRIDVHVLDVERHTPPERVVAVPTYLLDGAIVSLGNPAPEELFARLEAALA